MVKIITAVIYQFFANFTYSYFFGIYRVGQKSYASSGCKFPAVYMCQKLFLKMIESRQSYCNENRVQFFWPTWYVL